jgi:hypothetical protein
MIGVAAFLVGLFMVVAAFVGLSAGLNTGAWLYVGLTSLIAGFVVACLRS